MSFCLLLLTFLQGIVVFLEPSTYLCGPFLSPPFHSLRGCFFFAYIDRSLDPSEELQPRIVASVDEPEIVRGEVSISGWAATDLSRDAGTGRRIRG